MLRLPAPRALAALLALPLCALTACGTGETTPFDGERAMAHVQFLYKFGPRPAGSRALTQAADYIQKTLTDLGLKPQVQRWREETYKLDLQNIWVQIDGEDPENGPILAIGAHYDTKNCQGHPEPGQNFAFHGSIDGTGGPAVLLELARQLKDRKTKPNIWLVWLDGEENVEFEWTDDEKALFGSRHFVKEMADDKTRFPKGLNSRMRAMILLDLVGDKNPKVDRDTYSNSELLEVFGDTAKRMRESARMFETTSGIKDDHLAFIRYGVASINLIDFAYRIPQERARKGETAPTDSRYVQWWHTERDNPEQMSPFGLKFFGDLVLLALPEIEKRFFGK
ncbi:MAG: M28 family peptidase [Planctomycetota bacterium]